MTTLKRGSFQKNERTVEEKRYTSCLPYGKFSEQAGKLNVADLIYENGKKEYMEILHLLVHYKPNGRAW